MSQIIASKPKISSLQLFEENYRLLMAVSPDMSRFEQFAMGMRYGSPYMMAEVVERGRYTTTLAISKSFRAKAQGVPNLSIRVRAYHDAGVAEVLSYQGCDHIPPRYLVRGDTRYLKDEKQQVNQFLNHLLRHCLVGCRSLAGG